MNFREKIKSAKPSEIIQAMVDGLQKEHVKVDMKTFGEIRGGICFGCAATNCIIEISGVSPETAATGFSKIAFEIGEGDDMSVSRFECAIDDLRINDLVSYNHRMRRFEAQEIPSELFQELPELTTGNWKRELYKYQEYANFLQSKGY